MLDPHMNHSAHTLVHHYYVVVIYGYDIYTLPQQQNSLLYFYLWW